ncbi:Protein of unknown function (DUF3352) [Leptolyngbyaceae cyanobacterium JSC-12]|nr:Protein of unknown function (DUF3352) [Leptolyngbyaceae cyanobacterium JSC-12]
MIAKKAKPPLLLTLGTAAVLVAGGGAAYWYFSQPKAGPGDMPVGAEVIPQDALMAVSVTTNPSQWQQLRGFGTPQSQAAFDKSLAQMRDRLLTANGFDYQRDIQPWVGEEVTVAFLGTKVPFTAPPGTANQQPVVMVLPIRDALKAKQVLEAARPASGKVVNRAYKGFQIQETQGGAQNYSATVLDGKFLVVATDPKATDQAIDSYTSKTNLANTPGFSKALGQVKVEQPFGKVYVNLPAAAAISAANAGKTLSPQDQQQLQQNQGLAATATLQPDGIQFKSVSWLKPDSQRKFEVQNNAKVMPSRLPANTIMMVSGGDLQKFWRDYSQGATSNPITPIDPKLLQEGIRSTVGMDWEQDFLSWMNGEFAIALASPPEGNSPSLPFSLLILAKAGDRRAAEASLKKLDEAMVSRYKFQVQETQVNGSSVTSWTIPQSGALINRGWLDGDVAFLSLGAPIASEIVPRATQPLADSEAFKKAMPMGLSSNNGHFFVNVDQAVNSKRLPLLQLPPGNRELVAAIRSIGVTAAIADERSSRYDVFVALQKGSALSPLPSPTVPPAPSPTP